MIGQTISKIIEKLGEGGMAAVCLARILTHLCD
jgi:hypothetical protein